MKTITLQDILKGYTTGEVQSAGIMKILPLLTNNPWQDVGDAEKLYIKSDSDYAELEIANDDEKINIIPQGMMWMSPESGQDRIIPSAKIIQHNTAIFVNVNCVQPSESGHFRENREREFSLMPVSLRESGLRTADDKNYNSLWSVVEKFLSENNVPGRELVNFFKSFKNELDSFVAQFEPVSKQVGAIIFINDRLAGIEIYPHYKFWNQVWRKIIRDGYGSEAVSLIKKGLVRGTFKARINPDEIDTFEDLENSVENLQKQEYDFTQNILKETLDEEIKCESKQELSDYTLENLNSSNLIGQAVGHGPDFHTIYMSLVPKNFRKSVVPPRQFNSRWGTNKDPYKETENFKT